MALSFPNQSRVYDATRRAVRFWGHDSAMETSFFVTEDALKRIQPSMQFDEAGLLNAFDANRDRIYATAAKVYARGRRGSGLAPVSWRVEGLGSGYRRAGPALARKSNSNATPYEARRKLAFGLEN